jgi:protein gp37
MNKTKIDYVDYSWNPVWGCKNDCPYCYARKTAERFGQSFEPHWKEKNFNRGMPKKPSWIFVNSMSDVAYWKKSWLLRTLSRIEINPEHRFLFLTKIPPCYEDRLFTSHVFPNVWLGVSVTNQNTMSALADLIFDTTWDEKYKLVLSIEPILAPIDTYVIPDWLIVGAETGNRKDKVIPEREWIENIYDYCQRMNVPIWMKDNLKNIWKDKLIQERPEIEI